jgi:CheY-like chemotaxis protein
VSDQTILVVEDDPIQRRQIARALVSSGYPVAMAATGEEAMGILAEDDIDIVLTDRRMPGMDGVELLERIRQKYPGVLVALITAYPGENDSLIPDALLSKPFGHQELIDLVQKLSQGMEPLVSS